MNSDWIIRARITKKGNIRPFNTEKGPGKLLNIDLVDYFGT